MFKSLKNLESSFKHIRLFTIVVIAASVFITCFVIQQAFQAVEKSNNRIYLLSAGKAMEAIAAGRKDNIPVELRDHITMFHHYFFSLQPDMQVIDKNINKALGLADHTAKNQYADLKESGFYTGIITGNVSQEIEPDSISLNMDSQPYYFRYHGKLKITRPTVIVRRNLVTEGYVRSTTRSDNNSHGFLIERWKVLDNKDLSIENR